MEGQPAQPPLKVCPHCSVASRTDADVCPSCGEPYSRGRRRFGTWWIAIPIVAAAFAIGYFGISNLIDDEPTEITPEEASAIEQGSSRSAVVESLGEPLAEEDVGKDRTCIQYALTDAPQPNWLFCFQRDKLISTSPVGE